MNSLKYKWITISVIAVLAIGTITNGFLYSQTGSELKNAQSEINTLENQTATLSSNISVLDNRISSLLEQIGVLVGQITVLGEETEALRAQDSAVVDSVAEVMPSVVYIYVESVGGSPGQIQASSGSGVILSPDGYILTNRHVVEGATYAEVILQDRRVFQVSGIWMDDILDLAVVKINGQNLTSARLGDTSTMDVGDVVIALGHPLGVSPEEGGAAVTIGIVSNLGRSFWIEDIPYYDVIQTDAAINPGNSGGPLINTSGEVIGINSAGLGEAQNIGFAINVATAGHVFEDLVQYGQAHHPYLGVYMEDNIRIVPGEPSATQMIGAVITNVDFGSPAYLAGLRPGDVIMSFGEEEIASAADLIKVLWRLHFGDSVAVVVQRGITEISVNIDLTERPPGSDFI